MKKWLKNSLASIFAVAALSMPSMASANECCDPCGYSPYGRELFTNFFVTSSTLYWQTCTDTDYAVSATSFSNTGVSNNLVGGKTHNVDLDWDWGFTVGLGYQYGCDGWDARLNWTRFHTHDHSSITAAAGGTLQANIVSPAFNVGGSLAATSATAEAKVHYDTLDILFSKSCCICSGFSARPYFGARVLWLNRNLSATYTGGVFVGEGGGIKWKSDYTASGLHAGTEFLYDIGCDFYLVADVAGSLVAGDNDGRQILNITRNNGEGTTTSNIDLKDDGGCLVSYNYELSLGAKYRTVFCGCWNVDWTLTYDFVHWNRVPELSRLVDDTSITASTGGRNGSVSFHGVSFASIWRF